MTLNKLLNSDLTTIVAELRRGYDWWVEELAALVPAGLRGWITKKSHVVRFDGVGGLDTPEAVNAIGEATVVVPRDSVLVREIVTPSMTGGDLDRMLSLNAERYFPLPSGSILFARAIRPDRAGTMTSDVAAFPLSRAQALADAVRAAGLRAQAVRVCDKDRTVDPRFDFLAAMRAAGLIGKVDPRTRFWWIAVSVMTALNLATVIWRDSADIDRLQSLVDSQRPAVAVAQRMKSEIRKADMVVREAATQRRNHDALGALAMTTAAVPDGAWVQRYAWNDGTLRLTGYRSRDADVAAALRRTGGFANVKSAQTDAIAENFAGQPFDLVAEIRPR